MANVKLKFDGPLGDLARNGLDRKSKDLMGKATVDSMLTLIKSGSSPVFGVGRFEAYATQRGPVPDVLKKRYPFNVAGKKVRPVNLTATGEMLDNLSFQQVRDGVKIGFFSGLTPELIEKIQNAQRGNFEKNVPARPFIPVKGQRFVESIRRAIKNALVNGLKSKLR